MALPHPLPGWADQRRPAQDGFVRRGPERDADLDGVAVLIERAGLEVYGGNGPRQDGAPGRPGLAQSIT